MANKYPISIEEKFALIEQVLGEEMMAYIDVSFEGDNKFYVQTLGNYLGHIKFNDYDADIKLSFPSPEYIRREETRRLMDEIESGFKGKARALRRALRLYKEEKFGESFIVDSCRYYEIKDRLFTKMQENNKNISKLKKEIEFYQRKNERLNPIISDIEKLEKYVEELECE